MNTLSISMSQLVSISELQRDYASLVERIKKMALPLFLLRRNVPEAVLISIPAYEKMAEKSRLYEEKLALGAIAEFERDRKAGRLLIAKKPEDLLKKIK